MESLYFLIPLSIVVTIGAVALFFWAVNSGQYDDLESESERILFDDDIDLIGNNDSSEQSSQSLSSENDT